MCKYVQKDKQAYLKEKILLLFMTPNVVKPARIFPVAQKSILVLTLSWQESQGG